MATLVTGAASLSRWRRGWHTSGSFGGRISNYDPNVALPAEVRAALDVLADHLASLDRLKDDEATVTAWRAENARARAHAAAEYGTA